MVLAIPFKDIESNSKILKAIQFSYLFIRMEAILKVSNV
jgi:hypothetical protein